MPDTIYAAKTKALIRFAVTAPLICIIVFVCRSLVLWCGGSHDNEGIGLIVCLTGYHFSCSAQMRLKFILLINVKMPTIVGILTFISRINY